jgi:hypothetical protein
VTSAFELPHGRNRTGGGPADGNAAACVCVCIFQTGLFLLFNLGEQIVGILTGAGNIRDNVKL